MRSTSLVSLSLSISLAAFVLSGCNNSTVTTSPNNPSSPSTPSGPSNPGTPTGSSSNVAYVYVSGWADGNTTSNQTTAYAAASNGQLTAVPGSPFTLNISKMAANSSYLVASPLSGQTINSYTIGSNGALTAGPQFNYAQIASQIGAQIDGTCGMSVISFDPSGQSLYSEVACTDVNTNQHDFVGSFALDSKDGSLNYLGDAETGPTFNGGFLSIPGNDQFAYQLVGTGCSTFTGGGFYPFSRASSGLLTAIPAVVNPKNGPPIPAGATSGAGPYGYFPIMVAADNTNHLAVAEAACFFVNGNSPPLQLASYTVNADGSITTTDTYTSMPSTTIDPMVMSISPSGTVLAVAGSGGVQLFHFNGASSVTAFTGILTTDYITQLGWDNSNHLYALDPFVSGPGATSGTGKLHVFNLTDTGATEVTGSPYSIPNGAYLAVSAQPQ